MSGTILILEVIRKNSKVVDTVCDMDGFRGHMHPEDLVEIRAPGGGMPMKIGRITRSWPCSCGCHSTWDAEYIYGDLLGVSEWVEDREYVQFIALNEGDYGRLTAELDAGACPICYGWEDGCGNPVKPFDFGEEVEQ